MPLLLQLWREACRNPDLGVSIVRLAALVRRAVPADVVLVRHYTPDESLIETVAVGTTSDVPVPRNARHDCSGSEAAMVAEWLRNGSIACGPGSHRPPLLRALVPDDLRGRVMAAPLSNEGRPIGMLVIGSSSVGEWTASELASMESFREPFAAALANHWRFQEATRMRTAAEADYRALLSKLKRQEIVEEIVGAESTLSGVMEQVAQVAPTNAPVLILGETGTGKEVIARAIHARSARHGGPIIRVNCGAIPPELIDSELFGHEKGSFTGAVSDRPGWFERADGGTLFLDEIGDLSLAAQVRLLRVLQDGSYERVGGRRTRTADVRLIAATHRDMEQLVTGGQFREDLWYRISVFPIYLPPLRARQADFPILVRHFATNAGLRLGGSPIEPSAMDMRNLAAYPWPGNVRELSAVIERAAILGGGQRLDIAGAMGTKMNAIRERAGESMPSGPEGPTVTLTTGAAPGTGLTLDNAMSRHIEEALRRTAGRVEGPFGAAKLLGLHPNTLRGRMKRLGIDRRTLRR